MALGINPFGVLAFAGVSTVADVPCAITGARAAADVLLKFFFNIGSMQRGFDIGRVQSCVLRLPKY